MTEKRKLKQNVYALFTQTWKKELRDLRNSLIFSVDQPGLEPGTSRLWVRQNDILWFFNIKSFADYQIVTIFAPVYDTP